MKTESILNADGISIKQVNLGNLIIDSLSPKAQGFEIHKQYGKEPVHITLDQDSMPLQFSFDSDEEAEFTTLRRIILGVIIDFGKKTEKKFKVVVNIDQVLLLYFATQSLVKLTVWSRVGNNHEFMGFDFLSQGEMDIYQGL